ncbi:TIR domain-containing protein [uncultured Methanoregula sp.]|uniref:TIR domain-containing protein n=1 Tax=uncultured Methanoregula sp. TaxID=1005933 RepID=UPI002AAC0D7B|nr:TIR domain-containing protein [uncultured Methanoregula sp.]
MVEYKHFTGEKMTTRHKVFVSYHHEPDQEYRNQFERICSDIIVSRSVEIGDIDPNLNTEYVRQKIRDEYLKDSTVTVVLVGNQTWQRKHVDWEIYSCLRDSQYNPRSGLLGIILPTYPRADSRYYEKHTIPPRLSDNLQIRNDGKEPFAKIYNWSTNPNEIQQWIHEAFLRKDQIVPINNRPMYGKNHIGSQWSD